MARIIVTATPVYGHFAPMQAIAAHLVDCGHHVTMLTGSVFRESVESAGAAFVALSGEADLDVRTAALVPERLALPVGLPRFEYDMREWFIKPLTAQHRSLQTLLAEAGEEPVVVLTEGAFVGAIPTMRGSGLRPAAVIGIGVVPLTLSSADTAPFGTGLPPDSSAEGQLRNRAANTLVQERLLGAVQGLFDRLVRSIGPRSERPVPFFLDAPMILADRFLQLSVPELDYQRGDAPESLQFAGTLPNCRATETRLPNWWQDVVAAERVVTVTQGTLANRDFGELIEPTLEALADLDLLVVAATGRPGMPRRMPANARVAQFLPFDLLLPHTDVLVSNGGYGGVQLALSHGVPLVVAGDTESRPEITARAALTGAAVNLGTGHPTVPDIRRAVEDVLDTPSYRQRAEYLKSCYASRDAFAAIKRAIVELARTGV